MMKWQEYMSEGSKSFREGRLQQAIKSFGHAVTVAISNLEKAEAFHVLALTHLKLGNARSYYESEKMAARYYADFDAGQAADFLKHAGDVLARLRKHQIATGAYRLASEYFSTQSLVEEYEDLRLAWRGWSFFCIGKSDDNSASFMEAADCFSEAAKVSKGFALQNNRIAKAHLATALGILFDIESEKKLAMAREHLREAEILEPNNLSFRGSYLAIDSLVIMTKLQKSPAKNKDIYQHLDENMGFLRETLSSMEYTFLLVKDLDRITSKIQSELPNSTDLNDLKCLLLELLKSIS